MTKNTITILGKLRPGDVFTKQGKTFVKVDALPVRRSKHLFECAAIQVGRMEPTLFKATTEVQYLFTALSIT